MSLRRYILYITALLFCLLIIAFIALQFGAVTIPTNVIWHVLKSQIISGDGAADWSHAQERILIGFRVPRLLLAILVGAGLAISGALLQAVTRNVLADPYLFGLSSGASLGVVLVLGLGITSVAFLPVAAFLGGIAALTIVVAISHRKGRNSTEHLVLAGVATAFLFSAAVNAILYISDHNAAQSALFWMLGALGGARWNMLLIPFLVVTISSLVMFSKARQLDALLMGDETAETLGVDTRKLRLTSLILATIITATLVAYAGTIGFVGLVIPHICRSFIGGGHIRLLPMCLIVGALFLTCVDTVSRTVFAPMELPIGVVTAAIGGIYFLYLLKTRFK